MFDQVAMEEYLWKCDWIFGYQMCGQKLQVIKEDSFYIRRLGRFMGRTNTTAWIAKNL